MNLLVNALSGVNGLIQNQEIRIIINHLSTDKGYPNLLTTAVTPHISHIQPLELANEYKNTDSTIDSVKKYRIYLLGDKINLINSQIDNADEYLIEWGKINLKPYAKEDWSLNGWICIYATLLNGGIKSV